MPPKKKDSSNDKPAIIELQADHELFLQAFEKPTQIYRYLRTRNLISPIFLHRTLYYMKGRMSRNHKNRTNFKTELLLGKLQQKTDNQNKLPGTFLNIIFTGFFDKTLQGASGDIARIETHVVKICHKKRKESSAPLTQFSVGNHDVTINPNEGYEKTAMANKTNMLSVPTHHFTASNGHQVKSYILVFRVSVIHDQENVGEPLPKRRRISRNTSQESSHSDSSNTANNQNNINGEVNGLSAFNGGTGTCYGAELIVYDRHGRCQLASGQYELVAHHLGPDAPPPGKTSPKKNVIWESLDSIKMDGPLQELQNSPVLKFSLSWTEANSSILEKPKLRPLQPLDVAMTNNNAAKPKPQGVASPEAPQLVLYQFIYNNNSRQQTEARYDFHCPWCSLKCCALYSLLKHLKLCHARFSFTYVPHPKGARIDVSLNECYDGSYAGNPQDLVLTPTGCSFSRSGPTRRSPTTSVLVCKPKRSKPSLSEFLEQDDNDYELPRSYILGHNRLYHHTMTCLPVQPHELDEDSEGEHDSKWVRTKTKMMIDEFSDVNNGEKELMKMWNLHVMKYNYVGDCQLPLACYMFLDNHGMELLEKNLSRNFILHMASLHDFGLVGSGTVYKCIMMLHSRTEDEKLKKHFLDNWEEMLRESKRPFLNSPSPCTPRTKTVGKTSICSANFCTPGEQSRRYLASGDIVKKNLSGGEVIKKNIATEEAPNKCFIEPVKKTVPSGNSVKKMSSGELCKKTCTVGGVASKRNLAVSESLKKNYACGESAKKTGSSGDSLYSGSSGYSNSTTVSKMSSLSKLPESSKLQNGCTAEEAKTKVVR